VGRSLYKCTIVVLVYINGKNLDLLQASEAAIITYQLSNENEKQKKKIDGTK